MTIDKDKVLNIVNDWIYEKYEKKILMENGRIDVNAIISIVNQQQNITNSKEDVSSTCNNDEKSEGNIVVDVSGKNQENGIKISFDKNKVIMYVPKDLQEKILFAIEYIFSEFDKIQGSITDIAEEIQLNREGILDNAKKELEMRRGRFTPDSRQLIIELIKGVGDVIEQTRKSIIKMCNDINNIPQDRIRRIFNTTVKGALGKVRIGRQSVCNYLYGVVIYTELNLKIGNKEEAVMRMQDAIEFLTKMKDNGYFERVEQWNESKDLFWKYGIDEQIKFLSNKLTEINDYSGKIAIDREIPIDTV